MKKIHFYKNTNLEYSVWANNIEEVKLAPLDYYNEYTADMIISDVEYKNPILENKTLREATREELIAQGIEVTLNEGEKIVENQLIAIPRPSKYHKWNGTDWTVDIYEVKKLKRDELKAIRDKKINENIEVHGALFQVREQDTAKFALIGLGLALGKLQANGKEKWVLADNTVKTFTNSQLVEVLVAKEEREREIFTKFIEFDTILQSLNDVSSIEALEWE